MGNGADFFSRDAKGRRSEYVSLERAKTVNGVKGHIIKKAGDSDTHTNLPYYSNTSDVYFRKNVYGVCQARVYIGQKQFLDFDWSHKHTNQGSDGRSFDKGQGDAGSYLNCSSASLIFRRWRLSLLRRIGGGADFYERNKR